MTGVLLILADDERLDLLPFMPFCSGVLRAEGTEFVNAFCNVPICQAARVGILTGQYARRTGVHQNSDQTEWPTGYAQTIAPWVKAAGSKTTGHFGKVPNGYRTTVPRPGWDSWRVFTGNEQESLTYHLSNGVGGAVQPFTHALPTVAALVSSFITTTPGDWFAWWSPSNPHINTTTYTQNPLPRSLTRFGWHKWKFDLLTDTTNKPTWIANAPQYNVGDMQYMSNGIRGQIREAYDLDQAIKGLYNDLAAAGRLESTTIIFVSDGGVFFGEQRSGNLFTSSKDSPYRVASRVPMVVRGPDFPAGHRERTATCLQDVTATVLDLMGATATIPQDGTSLIDILANPDPDRAILYERDGGDPLPDGQGVFTSTHWMTRYLEGTGTPAINFTTNPNDEYEMYDEIVDPREKSNVANLGGTYLTKRNELEALLDGFLT